MLSHGSLEIEGTLSEIVLALPPDGTEALPMLLCGEEVEIRFDHRHLIELQELLKSQVDPP